MEQYVICSSAPTFKQEAQLKKKKKKASAVDYVVDLDQTDVNLNPTSTVNTIGQPWASHSLYF